MSKKRLDQLLVDRDLAASRTQAAAMVMAGAVSSDDRVLSKPGMAVPEDIVLSVKAGRRYVSRAGDKLASVAEQLGLVFDGRTILDVGSSTGGFSDYALQHGARRLYCVDVGNNQLAYKLRSDERVVVMERTDIRQVRSLPEQPDIALVDVSFISLTKVLVAVSGLLRPGAPIVAMAKPQFEAGRALADRFQGVIDDEAVRLAVLAGLEAELAELGYSVQQWADSAVAGAHGNRERFYVLKRNSTTSPSRMM